MSSDTRKNSDRTETVLVAIEVTADSPVAAQEALMRDVLRVGGAVQAWWFAEDERYDGSDNDSAVFVPMGEQEAWAEQVRAARDVTDAPDVTLYDGGLEVRNPHATGADTRPAGACMFGVVTEESSDPDEEGCFDYVLGHWPNGEEWVELARWPWDWDIAASMREVPGE